MHYQVPYLVVQVVVTGHIMCDMPNHTVMFAAPLAPQPVKHRMLHHWWQLPEGVCQPCQVTCRGLRIVSSSSALAVLLAEGQKAPLLVHVLMLSMYTLQYNGGAACITVRVSVTPVVEGRDRALPSCTTMHCLREWL
jgi:hypothetical protein